MTGRTSTLLVATLTVLIAGCSVRPALSSPPVVLTPTAPASTVPSLPIASSTPAPDPTPPAAPGATVGLDCEEPAVCRISLLDGAANVLPGWPVAVDGGCLGAATEPSGRVYVVCYGENDPVVHAFDVAGATVAGWPVSLPAPPATVSFNDFTSICGRHLSPLVVAADGGVYVSTFDEHTRLLHSFDRDGRERDAWPRPMPGDSIFGCGGFALLSDGTLRLWGYEGPPPVELELGYGPFAQRTVFTAMAADGTTLPGWPFGSTGTGSGPLFGADGTLYHVTEGNNVWAHDANGEPKPGWPNRLEETMSPYLAPDGRLVLLSSVGSGDITAIGPDGAVVAGWPRRLLVSRASACVFLGDVDCFAQVEPAFGPDGTLYLPLAPIADDLGGSILAFRPDGVMSSGWPFQMPDRTHAAGLSLDTAGNLHVATATCTDPCWETVEFGQIRISATGELLD